MPKDVSDEIDTIIEASEGKPATNIAERLMGQSTGISLFGEAASTKVEPSAAAALPEITLYFGAFPRAVYCNVDEIKLRLIQTGQGRGIAYSTFTQTCGGRGATWLTERIGPSTLISTPMPSSETFPRHMGESLRQASRRAESRLQLGGWVHEREGSLDGAEAATGRRLDDDGLAWLEHDLRACVQALHASILAPNEVCARLSRLAAIGAEGAHAAET
jgi:hypothetical protein